MHDVNSDSVEGLRLSHRSRSEEPRKRQNRFPVLYYTAWAICIVGGTILGVTLLIASYGVSKGVMGPRDWENALPFLSVGLAAYISGALILVLLQIEKNTRH